MPLHSTGGTVRPEGTFGLLRYLLGGRRPSETARQALSPTPIQGRRLEPQQGKGGISPVAPPELAPRLHSLPPILHMPCQSPTPGCSKGPRGLSVPPRVTSIFTGTETSPGPPLRQWPSRYAIHAGHNLRDKELRYLRTVRVTAVVYRGFGRELITPRLDLPAPDRRQPLYIPLRVMQGLVFLVNSRQALFSATLSGSAREGASPYSGPPSPEVTGATCRVP